MVLQTTGPLNSSPRATDAYGAKHWQMKSPSLEMTYAELQRSKCQVSTATVNVPVFLTDFTLLAPTGTVQPFRHYCY